MKTGLSILRLAGTLFLITALVAAALAGVNAVTRERIAAAQQQKLQDAISQVLPDGENLEPVVLTTEDPQIRSAYVCPQGYAVEVAVAGFGGTVTMMVGVSSSGTVTGVSVISHTETPGLGAVAAAQSAAGEAFRQQFVGMSGQLAVTKDGGAVDSITGATITSRAVTQGVNAALEWVLAQGGSK